MCRLTHSSVFIDRMKVYARHGVMEQERVVGADFEVSLRVDYDYSHALDSDALDDTISYASLCDIVRREMAVPSKLLEHVAGRIARAVMSSYPQTKRVGVKLVKLNPPMGADCQGAGVEVEFSL